MPMPKEGEDMKKYMARFMADEAMKEKYPDLDQRQAVGMTKWKKSQESMNHEDISGVEIFKAGSYYGHDYNEQKLNTIVNNTNKLIADSKHRPPGKLGHDDSQRFAIESGLPAIGWVQKVYKKGQSLYADFKDVPSLMCEAIKKKLYDSVSSEIYTDEAAMREFGVEGGALRAVAFLGADVPKVKGMVPLSAFLNHNETEKDSRSISFKYDENGVLEFGGQGSGNFGHGGRPGEVGGSMASGATYKDHANSLARSLTKSASPAMLSTLQHLASKYNTPEAISLVKRLGVWKERIGRGVLMSKDDIDSIKRDVLKMDEFSEDTNQNQGGQDMTQEEAVKLAQQAQEADKRASDAVKLAEEEKAKRIKLESDNRQKHVDEFCEKHKEVLIPALVPQFKAVATAQNGVVKFEDKDTDLFGMFLKFAESLISAKVVKLGEVAKDGKDKDMKVDEKAVKFEESKFANSSDKKSNQLPVENAELAILAKNYAEEHKVSYKTALLEVSKTYQKGE